MSKRLMTVGGGLALAAAGADLYSAGGSGLTASSTTRRRSSR